MDSTGLKSLVFSGEACYNQNLMATSKYTVGYNAIAVVSKYVVFVVTSGSSSSDNIEIFH